MKGVPGSGDVDAITAQRGSADRVDVTRIEGGGVSCAVLTAEKETDAGTVEELLVIRDGAVVAHRQRLRGEETVARTVRC